MYRFLLCALLLLAATEGRSERPNILWITAEDMSATLGCYGDEYAHTPHIDELAEQSARYTHAFATAPVCSPSRSTLITGCYATSLGTHQMRSSFPIPDFIKGFPSYLREAGYYTTNNVKTDYNTANEPQIIKASWDESSPKAHWRNRKDKSKPFFSVFNLMTSHQSRSMVWPREQFEKEVQSRLSENEIHDPAEAPLPPYYPDTPVIRRTVARFYDCVTAMDKEVGAILKQLEEDGLADDTIVFFYSDHGSGMPRHKRVLYDSGMHVPLLVRFPEKWKHLAPKKPGETTDRLVSFVDFGPTVLSIVGVDIPDYMQGKPFLGKANTEPREFVFGHRDRIDEVIDCARSVRTKRYLYIRNYMPHLGWNQPSAWPDQGEIRHEFYRLADRKEMTDAQWQFAGPRRPAEELYDCESDPMNLKNLLAQDPPAVDTQVVLLRMRKALEEQLTARRDLGFIHEAQLWERLGEKQTPMQLAARMLDYEHHRPIGLADATGKGFFNDKLLFQLDADDPAVRYWACVGYSASPTLSDKTVQRLKRALDDESASVCIEAANALARHGNVDAALPTLTAALEHEDLTTVLYAARAIELLGDNAKAAIPAMRQALARAEKIRPPDTPATVVTSGDQDLAMFIGFSTRAFLAKVAGEKGNAESADDDEQGISLFDGKTLEGWSARAKGDVQAKNGEIQILSKGANLWLVHEDTFADFDLTVEAHMPDDAYNSGIGFRCSNADNGGQGKPKGYQCEVAGTKSGMIYAIGSGWVWPKGKEETERFRKMSQGAFKDGEWNKFRIRCEGDRIQIWVNGVETADVRDDRFTKGSVALQHHGKGGLHRFRNIRIRKL